MPRWAVVGSVVVVGGFAAGLWGGVRPPAALAADEPPFALADLEKELKELDKVLKGKSPEGPLELFAKRALASLDVSEDRKEIRAALVKDFVPGVEKVIGKKGKVNDGSCRANVGKLLLALDDPKATGVCLDGLKEYRGCEDLTRAVVDPLAKRAVEPDRDAAQKAELRKRLLAEFKETLDKTPSALALLISAIRTLGGLEAVNLVADTAYKSAKKKTDLRGLEEVAKALGAWWEGQPHLEIRIPILLDLAEMKAGAANPIDAVAMEGLEKFASRDFQKNPKTAKKWWTELCKRLKDAKKEVNDAAIMIDSLLEKKKKAIEAKKLVDFKADVGDLIRPWNTPDFAWATPILLEIFGWGEPDLADLRGTVSSLLQQIRDPSAVPALMEVVATNPDVFIRKFALQTIGFLAAENDAAVIAKCREILRGKEPEMQLAAVETLGRVRGADALQEVLDYGAGFAAGGPQSKASLAAAARIGNEAAEAALLKLLNDAPDAEKVFVIEALGYLPKLPYSDAVAGALRLTWSGAQSLRAEKDARKRVLGEGQIVALVGTMLGGPNEGKDAATKKLRGLAHPTFLAELKSILTSVEPVFESSARDVARTLAESAPPKDIGPTMFEVLNLPDKERVAVALAWIEKHVDAAYRQNYIDLLKAKDKPLALRITMAGIVGRAPAWDRKEGYDAFLAVLQDEGRDEKSVTLVQEILKQIRDHQCKHVMGELVAKMETGPKAQTDYLTMAIAGVFSAWLQEVMPNPPDLARDKRAWDGWLKGNLGKLDLKKEECPK